MSTNLFFWFMNHRESIRLSRERSEPPPWTEDPVLQRYHFCNIFRDDDRVTRYWLDVATEHAQDRSELRMLIVNTTMFRLFNLPSTWEWLKPSWKRWNPERLLARLETAPRPIFNSAYMVTGSTGTGQPKHVSVIEACSAINSRPTKVLDAVEVEGTLQAVTEALSRYPMCGRFMGYEVACDLQSLGALRASDTLTWANLGPGAKRGLNRLAKRPLKYPIPERTGLFEMVRLYARGCELIDKGCLSLVPRRRFDMRTVEHTLCEFDKYQRSHAGDLGASLRRFKPHEEKAA